MAIDLLYASWLISQKGRTKEEMEVATSQATRELVVGEKDEREGETKESASKMRESMYKVWK